MVAKISTTYESDAGSTHSLLLEPDRLAVAGTPPAGGATSPIKAKVSKTLREFGIRPRGVRLARIVGTAPDTFRKYTFLPVLTVADFVSATFDLGATITIDGIAWEIVSKVQEDY